MTISFSILEEKNSVLSCPIRTLIQLDQGPTFINLRLSLGPIFSVVTLAVSASTCEFLGGTFNPTSWEVLY